MIQSKLLQALLDLTSGIRYEYTHQETNLEWYKRCLYGESYQSLSVDSSSTHCTLRADPRHWLRGGEYAYRRYPLQMQMVDKLHYRMDKILRSNYLRLVVLDQTDLQLGRTANTYC